MESFSHFRTDPYYRLMTLAATVILTGLLIACGVLLFLQHTLVRRSGETVAVAAVNTASRLDRVLFERAGDTQMMVRAFSGRTNDLSYLSAYLTWMTQAYPVYQWLAVLDTKGTVIASTSPEWVGVSRSAAEWFPRLSSGSGLMILDAKAYPETTNEVAVGFAAPIHGSYGELAGFVTSFVTLSLLEQNYLEMNQVGRMFDEAEIPVEYIVVNRDGLVLIDSTLHQEGRVNLNVLPSVQRLWNGVGRGFIEERARRRDVEVITGYARTRGYREGPNPDWGVLVRVPGADILAPVSRLTGLVAFAVLIVMSLLVGLLFTMMARLRQEMEKVRHSKQELEQRVAERTQEVMDKQQQLIQTTKLASLGQLSAGIAHELNNPLNNINLFIFNALDQVNHGLKGRQLQQPLQDKLNAASTQIQRASSIIENLRTFARKSGTDMGSVHLSDIVHAAATLLSETLRLGQIELSLELENGQDDVWGNTLQLEQVFVNLFKNASDALKDSAVKRITVTSHTEQEWQVVKVTDTGHGMTAEMLLHIFDPFYTTKEVGVGTGLGLSIVYGIIKDHGGQISVQSQPGQGALFEMRLPKGAPNVPPVHESPSAGSL